MNYSPTPPLGVVKSRLGEILQKNGRLRAADLSSALALQQNREARLGDILIAHRFSSQAAVQEALLAQSGGEIIDIFSAPPDPELVQGLDPKICVQLQAIPWKMVGKTMLIAAADHGKYAAIQRQWPGRIRLVQAGLEDIYQNIEALFGPQLTYCASNLCDEKYSCRRLNVVPQRWRTAILVGVALGLMAARPDLAFLALFCWALLSNIATSSLRLLAVFSFAGEKQKQQATINITRFADHQKRPRVSILIPLYKEDKVIPALLDAMERLTYPKELLDIKILLEENDETTRAALNKATLPHWAEIRVVPADIIQTKPRAMNYALPFCTGSIIGIYDAEDRPDPDQINKVVDHLATAPPDVVAVQCNLDFYNTDKNWLSRCFTIEYAAWFRVIMRGMQRMGLPLPLGGTSVFMRRAALERIGGWDAHNVTEDADLGMRLARFGYRCEMVNSTTWEEANNVPIGWIKQRSRWIKGFMLTWITHMRRPAELLQELGMAGFFGFQIVLLGTFTTFLLAPVFWVMWLVLFGLDLPLMALMPAWFWQFAVLALLLSEGIMVSIAITAIVIKRKYSLLPFVLTMPLYWPLGTIAAYKALFEVVTKPFYWDKTTHGLDQS